MVESRELLKNLILYVASEMAEAEHFGDVKLNKVLYRSEFSAFRELGYKLTTFHYQKNKFGPTLRAFLHVTQEMAEEGLISWTLLGKGKGAERRMRALVPPNISLFKPEEITIVKNEIDRAWNLTAREVSEEEHRTAAWYATPMNQTIRPELGFVEDPGNVLALTDAEHKKAAASIERYLARTEGSSDAHPRARVR